LGPHTAPCRALTNHVLSSFESTWSIQTYGKFKCCAIKNTPENSRKFDQRLARWRNLSKCASRGRLPPVEPARSTLAPARAAPAHRRCRPVRLAGCRPCPTRRFATRCPSTSWRALAKLCSAAPSSGPPHGDDVRSRSHTLSHAPSPLHGRSRRSPLSLPCLS
jgi:hypothetical protein